MVTEAGCLLGHSGSNCHIIAGIKYLNQHFKIQLFTAFVTKWSLAGRNKRLFLYLFVYSTELLVTFPLQFIQLWKRKPTFVYERYHLLNFNTLLICRCLKIPHFFEINGLWKEHHQSGILSWWEHSLIQLSNYSFCVGLRGVLIPNAAHLNIENGVSQSFWAAFKNLQKLRKKHFNICFLGTLMQHHRLAILSKTLHFIPLQLQRLMVLHFIGPINQHVLAISKSIPISIVLHGTQSEVSRINLLKKMDCGIVSGGGPYASFMKIFEYGSAKCPVIVPRTPNLEKWMEEDAIFFYQQDDPYSCAKALMKIYYSPKLANNKASRFYQLIGKRFLWEKTFSTISQNIVHHL